MEQLLDGAHGTPDIVVKRRGWFVGMREQIELKGCAGVDMEASTVTNTLLLKRVRLDVGTKLDLKVAWVRFPSLTVLPLRQR